MDFDLDDPADAIFVLAVLDDEESAARAGRTPALAGATRPDPGGGGCASGCGCGGCLLPALVIAAAAAAGFGALPLAAILGLAAVALAVLDRTGH
jgi:hypothetical protein